MILAGDVGGTKTLFAIYDIDKGGDPVCLTKIRYNSADFLSFNDLLNQFWDTSGRPAIDLVAIGVAGPIVNGDCHATNLPWYLTRHEIGQYLGTQQVYLLNDLEACAWGLLSLPEQQFVELNPAASMMQGNSAVIAAGTGLGEAIIAWNGRERHIIPTEGGHCDFAPRNAQEIALLAFMLELYPDHVSYERLVSGEGLVSIYRFLEQSGYAKADSTLEDAMLEQDAAAVIGAAGVSGSDALCEEAVRIFCSLYGAEAGNLALKCLPYAGVYLAGGIAGKLLPVLESGCFMEGFLAKGRYKEILQGIPVKVCLEQEVALHGALKYASQMASKF